jgi:hypothetical protein
MAVGLLQERGLMDGVLEPAFTGEQEHQRVEGDAQIQPERGVLHIPVVERAFFRGPRRRGTAPARAPAAV